MKKTFKIIKEKEITIRPTITNYDLNDSADILTRFCKLDFYLNEVDNLLAHQKITHQQWSNANDRKNIIPYLTHYLFFKEWISLQTEYQLSTKTNLPLLIEKHKEEYLSLYNTHLTAFMHCDLLSKEYTPSHYQLFSTLIKQSPKLSSPRLSIPYQHFAAHLHYYSLFNCLTLIKKFYNCYMVKRNKNYIEIQPLQWKSNKSTLVQLCYLIHQADLVNTSQNSIKEIATFLSKLFDLNLKNVYKIWNDIKNSGNKSISLFDNIVA